MGSTGRPGVPKTTKSTLEMLSQAAQASLRRAKAEPSKRARQDAQEALELLRREADRLAATLPDHEPTLVAYRQALVVVCQWERFWPSSLMPQDAREALIKAILSYGDWREEIAAGEK